MTTIRNKKVELYRSNPNGNADNCNDLNEYSVNYDEHHKYYYLAITPCTKSNIGYSFLWDFQNRYVTMCPVKRRNAKVQRMCEEWLERHVDYINDAYNTKGMDGVKEYFTLHWLAI